MKEGTAHNPKHDTSSVNHGAGSVMVWTCMAVNGTGHLVFTGDVVVTCMVQCLAVLASDLAKCFRTHWTELHRDGQ